MEEKKKKKAPGPGEKFWPEMVAVWFEFCRANFDEEPTFDGSAPKDLKAIVVAIRLRAEKKEMTWTLELATRSLVKFLEESYRNQWLKDHWLLLNLNRQKDQIFFNLSKNKKNGTTARQDETTGTTNVAATTESKFKGNFGQL